MDILNELWLQCICGFEPDMVKKFYNVFEGAANRFESPELSRRRLKEVGASKRIIDNFMDTELNLEAQRIFDYCIDNDIRIITPRSEEYPESLKNISLPPRLLFVKGKPLSNENEPRVAVVGCRKPTHNGGEAAYRIAASLASNGITVVGGMAEGVDGEGHRGALDYGGKTIAVLAGGVDDIYPSCNRKLYGEILEKGTIVSERPPKSFVRGYFYRQRNRILVGLCHSVVIVEGKMSSGTSMTAGIATEENRDIIAVPGNPVCWQSKLPNSLINDGAEMAVTIDTPAEYMKNSYPYLDFDSRNSYSSNTEKKAVTAVNSVEKKILEFLSDVGRVATNDEIAASCKIPQNVLSSTLTMLCIKGKIKQASGNRYVLTTD